MPILKNVKSGLCMAVHTNTTGRKIFVLQSKSCSWTFDPCFDADKAEQTCVITLVAAPTTQTTQTTQINGVTVLQADPGSGVHVNVPSDWALMKDDDDTELGFLQLTSGEHGKLQTSIVTIVGQWDIEAVGEKEKKKKYIIGVCSRSDCVLCIRNDEDTKVMLKQGGDKTDERNQWYIEEEETSTVREKELRTILE